MKPIAVFLVAGSKRPVRDLGREVLLRVGGELRGCGQRRVPDSQVIEPETVLGWILWGPGSGWRVSSCP